MKPINVIFHTPFERQREAQVIVESLVHNQKEWDANGGKIPLLYRIGEHITPDVSIVVSDTDLTPQ